MHIKSWGGNVNDTNGMVVEELMDLKNLVCMNDGNYTRVEINKCKKSALGLTLVSAILGGYINWEVLEECTIGSDHYPLLQ